MNNRKEVANKEEVEEISITQEEKEKKKKELKNKIRKLKKEIEKNDLEELIIDRTKGDGGISNKIDISAKVFQELGDNKETMVEEELAPGHLKD